jgi:nucleoside-diphosphate-sugar epimerase
MKVLATGTTGTIGRHLQSKAMPVNLDLSELSSIPTASYPEKSHLIHLAGVVGPAAVLADVQKSYTVNVSATLKLAEVFKTKSQGKFTYVSTSHVYSPKSDEIFETSSVSPPNAYAQQKLDAEVQLSQLFMDSPERLCIVRVFSVLDWDVAPFTLGGGVRKLTLEDSDYTLTNSKDVRDFLTPNTIAQSLFEVTITESAFGVLNLCSGTGISVGDAARKMLTESGILVPENRIIPGNSSNPVIVGSNSKLRSILPNLALEWTPSRLN